MSSSSNVIGTFPRSTVEPSAFDAICRREQSGCSIMLGVMARDKLSWREEEAPQRCPTPYSSDIFDRCGINQGKVGNMIIQHCWMVVSE